MVFARLADLALELPVAPSFTRLGHDVRSRTDAWDDPERLDGRTVLITGATSGIGAAAAAELADLGAQVIVTGRSEKRTAAACRALAAPGRELEPMAADMAEPSEVRALAARILDEHDRLDVLIHNAGALSADHRTNSLGQEATVASQVYGPFLLTQLLLERLEAGGSPSTPARVLTMSSGGMYAVPLVVGSLEMAPDAYDGTRQYAYAKRAQVTLNELWAERHVGRTVFHALHPGWVDTPGVSEALPTFGRVLGPLLRTPDQGADTLVWLAAADEPAQSSGGFWHDRRRRSLHKSPLTSRTDTTDRRSRLWEHVRAKATL